MKSLATWMQLLIVPIIAITAGCDKSFQLAEISGTVMLDGTPLTDAEVVFMPEPKPGNSVVGPFSTGMTDSNGRYTLKTRYGDPGAVVGLHLVNIQYDDVEPLAVQQYLFGTDDVLSQTEDEESPNGAETNQSPIDDDSVDSRISDQLTAKDVPTIGSSRERLKEKLNGRRIIPPRFSLEPNIKFAVPVGGTTAADFDLHSDPSETLEMK